MTERVISASHWLQLDLGALFWSTNGADAVADTASGATLAAFAASDKLAVYGWEQGSPLLASPERRPALVGVAAASIDRDSPGGSCISVTIHALAVRESSRQHRLDQALYARLHEAVFELGQQQYALQIWPFIQPAKAW